MAGLCSDLPAAIGVGGLHADLPGDHPGRAAGRGALHAGAVAVAAGLRPREHRQPDAGRAAAGGGELQFPLPWNGGGVRSLRGAGRLGPAAKPETVRAARHLRPHDARHPHLPRDTAPARTAGAEPRRRRCGRDGAGQLGRAGAQHAGPGRIRAGLDVVRLRRRARCWPHSRCRSCSTACRTDR